MRIMRPAIDLDRFFATVRQAPDRVLLLDFDGTLAALRSARERVGTYEGVDACLQRLVGANCRTVFVSGRSARDLQAQWPLEVHSEIWGSHGLERLLSDGTYVVLPIGGATLAVLAAERARLGAERTLPHFEFKPYGIALHTRGLADPAASELWRSTWSRWSRLAADGGLRVLEFDGGLELHAAGANKGTVVDTVLSELGPRSAAAFLGDDHTDEAAFLAIRGRGLAVLVRPELRPTAADLWLEPPGELVEFLGRWAGAVTGVAS